MPKKKKQEQKKGYIVSNVATLGYRKKPLGSWPDQIKHEEAKSLEEKDAESAMGHEPESGSDTVGDIDKIAKEMGIYDEDEYIDEPENPTEVSIADEIKKNNEG